MTNTNTAEVYIRQNNELKVFGTLRSTEITRDTQEFTCLGSSHPIAGDISVQLSVFTTGSFAFSDRVEFLIKDPQNSENITITGYVTSYSHDYFSQGAPTGSLTINISHCDIAKEPTLNTELRALFGSTPAPEPTPAPENRICVNKHEFDESLL